MHPGVHRQLCAVASPCSSRSVVSSVFPAPQDSPVQSSVQNPGTLLPYLMHTSCNYDCEKSCRKKFSGHTYHPLQALLLQLEEKVPLPWLLRTWGPLLSAWSLPLWDDLGAGTQNERWKNAYFSLSCSLNWRAFLACFFHASVSTSSF
jgi:hypothetical protein